MKIAAVLAAHRRLLALCAASLLVHLAVIGWLAGRAENRPGAPLAAAPAPLALRLAGRSAAASVAAGAAAPRARQAARAARPAPRPAPEPAALSHQPAAPSAPTAQQPLAAPAAEGEDTLVQMPGRYQVRMPPSARLTYDLVRALPGQAATPAGAARIDWQADGNRYTLRMDGVAGQLSSQGASGDAGIAPVLASEQRADGTPVFTRFDAEAGRIEFSAAARSAALHEGSQDRASLLMQLAGIGLAEPDQMQGVIEVFVGGMQDAGVVKFEVVGQEDVTTALGAIASWHLSQVVRAGETRLELWLAPQHGWLPVQLRATAPDGTVSTQVVTQIETGAVAPGG